MNVKTMPKKKLRADPPCPPITPAELKELREAMDLDQVKAAELLCVPVGTLRNWEQGRRAIPLSVAKLARLILK
jgi:putative transcriptional regulator